MVSGTGLAPGHRTESGVNDQRAEIVRHEPRAWAHASRRGLLQAGLAIGTLALGRRAALGQSGGAHAHMPELGEAKSAVVAAMDQPLRCHKAAATLTKGLRP